MRCHAVPGRGGSGRSDWGGMRLWIKQNWCVSVEEEDESHWLHRWKGQVPWSPPRQQSSEDSASGFRAGARCGGGADGSAGLGSSPGRPGSPARERRKGNSRRAAGGVGDVTGSSDVRSAAAPLPSDTLPALRHSAAPGEPPASVGITARALPAGTASSPGLRPAALCQRPARWVPLRALFHRDSDPRSQRAVRSGIQLGAGCGKTFPPFRWAGFIAGALSVSAWWG